MMDRSRQVNLGRLTWRLNTASCRRSRAFSIISSDLERVRSRATFKARARLSGFVHWRSRCLMAWRRDRTV
jgi:hypothetical protein